MAAERTWLAWWRTALAATAGALGVGRIAPNKKIEDHIRLAEVYKRYVDAYYRFIFVGRTDALPELWSVGLRNPWRFSFDAATGRKWMLAFEADELHRIVDLMRHLRGATARPARPIPPN